MWQSFRLLNNYAFFQGFLFLNSFTCFIFLYSTRLTIKHDFTYIFAFINKSSMFTKHFIWVISRISSLAIVNIELINITFKEGTLG